MPLPALPPPGVAIGTLFCFFKGDDAVAIRLETPRFNDPARPRTADSDLVVMVPVEAFLSVVVVVVAVGDLTSSESLLAVRSVRADVVDDDGPLRNLFRPLNDDEPARSSVDPVDVLKADDMA